MRFTRIECLLDEGEKERKTSCKAKENGSSGGDAAERGSDEARGQSAGREKQHLDAN